MTPLCQPSTAGFGPGPNVVQPDLRILMRCPFRAGPGHQGETVARKIVGHFSSSVQLLKHLGSWLKMELGLAGQK